MPAPLSIYEGISKLPPACVLRLDAKGELSPDRIEVEPYWSYRQTLLDGLDQPFRSEGAALEAIESAIAQSVMGQSLADVPVGAFLSGGVDSSTIVALCQKYSKGPVRTYTIGFEDPAFDEAPFARAVAKQLGTQHHEAYVTASEARDVIPKLASIYGEPFADSSQIPTFLVSEFARSEVKVALTGDGGDELFGGYNRYLGLAGAWSRFERLSPAMRAMAGGALGAIPSGWWQAAARAAGRSPQPHFGGKIQKSLRAIGGASDTNGLLASFLDEWSGDGSPVLGETSGVEVGDGLDGRLPVPLRMMYRDAISYLPDDILCKVDRASMAVSLESRVPYLDHRVAAVAARIPLDMKIRRGRGKHILRELLYREAPRHLFERPKSGFAIPVGQWIKGPLRDWAEQLLDPVKMAEDGWFDAGLIQRRWQDHLAGRRDSTAAIWAVLMFQAWLGEQKQPVPQPRPKPAFGSP